MLSCRDTQGGEDSTFRIWVCVVAQSSKANMCECKVAQLPHIYKRVYGQSCIETLHESRKRKSIGLLDV